MYDLASVANSPLIAGILVIFFGWLAKSSISHQFDSINQRFDAIDKRFDAVDREMAIIKSDIKSLDNRLSLLEGRVTKLEIHLEMITQYFMPQKKVAGGE